VPEHSEVNLKLLHQHRDAPPCITVAENVPSKTDWETDYKTVDEPVAVPLKETP
jgi:hypothetical protein